VSWGINGELVDLRKGSLRDRCVQFLVQIGSGMGVRHIIELAVGTVFVELMEFYIG
jgi:hypothetical protein